MSDEILKNADGVADAGTGNEAQANDKLPDSRRKLLKAGIIGLPVILTLKSKPAWARNFSALTSATHSTKP
jgi:hypothetical protein